MESFLIPQELVRLLQFTMKRTERDIIRYEPICSSVIDIVYLIRQVSSTALKFSVTFLLLAFGFV